MWERRWQQDSGCRNRHSLMSMASGVKTANGGAEKEHNVMRMEVTSSYLRTGSFCGSQRRAEPRWHLLTLRHTDISPHIAWAERSTNGANPLEEGQWSYTVPLQTVERNKHFQSFIPSWEMSKEVRHPAVSQACPTVGDNEFDQTFGLSVLIKHVIIKCLWLLCKEMKLYLCIISAAGFGHPWRCFRLLASWQACGCC